MPETVERQRLTMRCSESAPCVTSPACAGADATLRGSLIFVSLGVCSRIL